MEYDTVLNGSHHWVDKLDAIVGVRVVASSDHNADNTAVLVAGTECCKKTNSMDDGIEISAETGQTQRISFFGM